MNKQASRKKEAPGWNTTAGSSLMYSLLMLVELGKRSIHPVIDLLGHCYGLPTRHCPWKATWKRVSASSRNREFIKAIILVLMENQGRRDVEK